MATDEGENGNTNESEGSSTKTKQDGDPPAPVKEWIKLHREKLKHVGMHEWLMIIATIVMAASTTAYALYARRQLKAMEDQAFVTALAVGQTQHMIGQAIEQTRAAEISADAAKSAADTAAAELRPWVSGGFVLEAPLSISYDGTTAVAYIGLTLNNTGHSPALNVRQRSVLFEAPSDVSYPVAAAFIQKMIMTTCQRAKDDPFETTAIFPGSPQKLLYCFATIDLTPYRRLKGENSIMLNVLTCIDYQFPNSTKHHQAVYRSWLTPPGGGGVTLVEKLDDGRFIVLSGQGGIISVMAIPVAN